MIGFQKQFEDALQSIKQVKGTPKRNYRCVRPLMTLIDVTKKVKMLLKGSVALPAEEKKHYSLHTLPVAFEQI